ncbi:MAG: energy-coupled thiamine transporter ThiT [Clostridiales bacterium]|nr:energy-coupled thiamine transporter ThiT [Clostridiales bacterium]
MSEQKRTSRDNHLRTRALVEGAVMVALATALSYIKLFELPQGGSVCIGMLPIFLYCYRWGFSKGMLCSFAYGLLQLLLDSAYAWGWQSMILDYLLAFAVLGVAGLFAGKTGGLYVGTVVGSLCRFLCHFVAGFTIWRIYAPTELFNYTFTNPYLYSAVYNGSFVAIDMVLCIVIFALLSKPMEKYFTGADIRS